MLLHNGSLPQHVDSLTSHFQSIQHLRLEENRGFSGGANHLLNFAFERWEWVLFLTNDTTLESVPAQMPPRPGLYVPQVYLRKRERIDYQMGFFNSRIGQLRHLRENEIPSFESKSGLFTYAPGTAFLLHRDVFRSVGTFDETLHTYWEDVDFSVRCHKKGYSPKAYWSFEVTHAGGKTTRKDSFYTNFLFQRNRRIVSMRHCPIWGRPELLVRLAFEKLRKKFGKRTSHSRLLKMATKSEKLEIQ